MDLFDHKKVRLFAATICLTFSAGNVKQCVWGCIMSCFKMMFCKYNVDSVGSQLANYRCFCKIYLSLSSSRSHLHCSTRLIFSKHYHRIRFRKHKRWESYLFYFPSCRSTKKNTNKQTKKQNKQEVYML